MLACVRACVRVCLSHKHDRRVVGPIDGYDDNIAHFLTALEPVESLHNCTNTPPPGSILGTTDSDSLPPISNNGLPLLPVSKNGLNENR